MSRSFLLLLLLLLLVRQEHHADAFRILRPPSPMMFVFGDSSFDVGNNNFIQGSIAQANVTPYGSTVFQTPTGRFSDGRLIPDYIADFLGFPYIPPFLQPGASFTHGINFASAGSGLLNTTDANLKVMPLQAQVGNFLFVSKALRERIGEYRASVLLSRSLFMVSSGSDDIFGNIFRASTNRREFFGQLMNIYRTNIQQLYYGGARRFVLYNLGPLGCTPMFRHLLGGSCLSLANELAGSFNCALRVLVAELSKMLPGSKITYAKSYESVNQFLNNGTSFGFANIDDACCGQCGGWLATRGPEQLCENPGQFLFWDFMHPTEYTYSMLAKYFWEGDSSYIEPWNIKSLLFP